MTLDLTPDELLATTRSVRKRLDLTRPVERQVVLDCLDLALQAPTGSNRQGWAWMFVEDADKKRAIADLYEGIGGTVFWYGKPHAAIYQHALGLAGSPDKSTVIAIGDALPTDVLGAARQGIDCIFVTGGIHAGEPFPAAFAPQYGLGDWAPVAVVDSLG